MKPLLIVQTSPAGSTLEIAGLLQKAFEGLGRPAEVAAFDDGRDPSAYSGVIAASPIHGMRWMPEAVAWVEAHREVLRTRPCALVAVSYLYFEGRASWKASILKGLEAVRAPLPHASVQVFGGRLPSPLPTPARWLFGVKKGRPLDLVDPAAVAAWAADWGRTLPVSGGPGMSGGIAP
jgi:menaquinone-dependent protoporphyrinogen IX oxidase